MGETKEIIEQSAAAGVDPHVIDGEVAELGWEPHDQGFADAVRKVIERLVRRADG